MFNISMVDSDLFLEMPISSQALYFHLGMRSDDDGFVSNPKRIIKLCNCSDDDLRLLILKNFVILFDSGICVITHHKINNLIRSDRYKETLYLSEKSFLIEQENGVYSVLQPYDNQMTTNGIPLVCIDKVRLDKIRIDKEQLYTNSKIENSTCFEYYENKFGLISSNAGMVFNDCIVFGLSDDVIKLAIDEAIKNNARGFGYIQKILERCKVNNILTADDWKAEQEKSKTKGQAKTNYTDPERYKGQESNFNAFGDVEE